MDYNFQINDFIDAQVAQRLLINHICELNSQKDAKVIEWQKDVINQLEKALYNYNELRKSKVRDILASY